MSRETRRPVLDAVRALGFFSQGLRQHMLVEREVSDEPFEPAIFFLHLPEAPQLAHAEVRVLLLPGVEGGVTHPELSAEVADRGAAFSLADRVDNLFLGKLRPLHWSTPFVRDRRSRHVTLVLTCRRFLGRRQHNSPLSQE